MDLAIIASARFPIAEPFAGGMEMHTFVLASELTRRGHHVTVYGAGGDGPFDVSVMAPLDFVPTLAARQDVSTLPEAVMAEHHSYLHAIVQLAGREHDLVHVNAVHHLPFASSALLPCPMVGTLHCPPTAWLESALVISAAGPRPPTLVSVSAANAASWAPVEISTVIHNGVDLQRWKPGPGGPGAVWTGRIVPEKAPHLAIDAARMAGVEMRLFGPIHHLAYFDEVIVPRLGRGITYEGHLSLVDVADAVAHSLVAVVTPAWDEPFGLVVPESLACGTPVAAFARGAMAELIDEHTGVLVAAGDVVALGEAITSAAGRDRATCRQVAVERFSAETMVDAYEATFDAALARAA